MNVAGGQQRTEDRRADRDANHQRQGEGVTIGTIGNNPTAMIEEWRAE